MPPNACRIACAARLASRQSQVPSNSASHGPGRRRYREVELHDRLAAQQRLDGEPRMIRADQHRHDGRVAGVDAVPCVRCDDCCPAIGSASRDIRVTGASGATVTMAPKWR